MILGDDKNILIKVTTFLDNEAMKLQYFFAQQVFSCKSYYLEMKKFELV